MDNGKTSIAEKSKDYKVTYWPLIFAFDICVGILIVVLIHFLGK